MAIQSVRNLRVNFLQDGADKVKASIDDVSGAVDRFGKKTATASVGLDDKAISPKLDAIRVKLDALAKRRDTLSVNVDTSKAEYSVAKFTARLDALSKKTANPNISLGGVKQAELQLLGLAASMESLEKIAADSGGRTGNNYGSSFYSKVREFGRVGGLWENAILAGITALPAVLPVLGLAAAASLGGALILGVTLLDPKVKAAATSLGKSLGASFIKGTRSSGFDQALVTDFGKLKTGLAGPVAAIGSALGKAFLPYLAPITNGLIHIADWLSVKLPGALATAKTWLAKVPWATVGSDIGKVAVVLGKILVPAFLGWESVMGPVIKAVAGILVPIGEYLAANPKLVAAIGAALAAWKLLSITMALNPYVAFALATVAIATLVYKYWGDIKQFFVKYWPWMVGAATGSIGLIVVAVIKNWTTISKFTSQIWGDVFKFFKMIWGNIENVATGGSKSVANWVTTGWSEVYTNTVNYWHNTLNFFTQIWGHIENVTTGAVKSVENWIITGWNTIFQDTEHIWNAISAFFVSKWNSIENTMSGAANWVRSKLSSAWSLIKSDAKADWVAIVNVIGSAFNAVKNIVMQPIKFVVDDIWDPFAGFVNKALGVFGVKARIPTEHLATGGLLPGYAPGHDVIPAMLSPGEFVVRPEAVKAIGADNLHALNSGYHQFPAGTLHFANGGAVPGDNQILMDAEKYKGHRYVWGGPANPTQGWDCSSFVGYVLGHDFGLRLPGGVSWNPNVHGPVASQYNNTPGFNLVSHNTADILPGDLLVENSGGHVGFGAGPNSMFSAYGTAYGTLLTSAANMTNIYRYHGALSPNGPLSAIGGVLTKLASWALNGITGLATGALNHIPGIDTNPIAKLGKDAMLDVFNGAKNALTGNQNNYTQPAGSVAGSPGGNPVPGGATGSSLANGKELYSYLLTNLFGGHKVAAAGAIASIWGESAWNPFAQGTGGRGLIGWTPPSTISNSDFTGGMRTQLPAIIRFVSANGDMGVIQQMDSATSILQAANLWGKGVERYGINDVHAQGLALAASIMGQSPTQIAAQTASSNTSSGSFNGYAYANGGLISEPVLGRGLRSGSNYLIGENGPEWVVPQGRTVSAGGGGGDVYNIMVDGDTDPDGAALRIIQTVRKYKQHHGGQSTGIG